MGLAGWQQVNTRVVGGGVKHQAPNYHHHHVHQSTSIVINYHEHHHHQYNTHQSTGLAIGGCSSAPQRPVGGINNSAFCSEKIVEIKSIIIKSRITSTQRTPLPSVWRHQFPAPLPRCQTTGEDNIIIRSFCWFLFFTFILWPPSRRGHHRDHDFGDNWTTNTWRRRTMEA